MQKENWINETLTALNTEKQDASPYLLTRLHARLNRTEETGVLARMILWISRPAVALSMLLMILACNGWAIASKYKHEQRNSTASNGGYREDFASTLVSVYDYENQEP